MSLLSDADRSPAWRAALSLLRAIFPEQRWQHPVGPSYLSLWLVDGRDWDAAAELAAAQPLSVFSDAGVAVVRSSAERTANMLIIDNGLTDAGHSHLDNLTIHWAALGRPAIVDPGRAVYRRDAARQWVVSAYAHNTTCIEDAPVRYPDALPDDRGFVRLAHGDSRCGPLSAAVTDGIASVESWFGGLAAGGASSLSPPRLPASRPLADWTCRTGRCWSTSVAPR